MSTIIYCISGLGADEKIFKHLSVPDYTLKCLSWLLPEVNESMAAYARRMAAQITEKNPILLGVSFGGMMAIEIAKHIPVHRLILVSSVKSDVEIPRWMKWVGRLRIYKLVPPTFYRHAGRLGDWRLGVSSEEERALVAAYRRSSDLGYLKWAIRQILQWHNNWVPPHTLHIHGEGDRIFPVTRIKDSVIVKGATHFMVYNKAGEVGKYISAFLQHS
jgi:pimeloyl-ACP methyl ester carboxylesterase